MVSKSRNDTKTRTHGLLRPLSYGSAWWLPRRRSGSRKDLHEFSCSLDTVGCIAAVNTYRDLNKGQTELACGIRDERGPLPGPLRLGKDHGSQCAILERRVVLGLPPFSAGRSPGIDGPT